MSIGCNGAACSDQSLESAKISHTIIIILIIMSQPTHKPHYSQKSKKVVSKSCLAIVTIIIVMVRL